MQRQFVTATLALLVSALLWASPASATPILQGGEEIIDNALGENFMQGYDFVSTTDQWLTALGFWDRGSNGLPRPFQVGLWDTASQQLLASAEITSADVLDTSVTVNGGQWRYQTLANPIALSSGTSYTLAWQDGPLVLDAADTLLVPYYALSINPTVTIANRMRFLNVAGLAFPTDGFGAGDGFRSNVNAQLTPMDVSATDVVPTPEPATLALLGTGLVGATVRRYRRRCA